MARRVIEISNPARLSVCRHQLVIDLKDSGVKTVPMEDIGILILDNYDISISQSVLVMCAEKDVMAMVCDRRHLPSGLLFPLVGHTLQTKTIALQISSTIPTRKRIWKKIVREKILRQAQTIRNATKKDLPELIALAERIRSGDPGNIEAQAARIYWRKLFGDEFRRKYIDGGINVLLNYGYAILRAAIARSIVGAGLHPSLGIHHHSKYDAFCLADDLIEPFRPLVDYKVFMVHSNLSELSHAISLTPKVKKELLGILYYQCIAGEFKGPLFTGMHQYASSLRKALDGEPDALEIPKIK